MTDNTGVRVLALLVMWSLCLAAVADVPPPTPDAARHSGTRLVQRFDFEEREAGNVEDLPRFWYPIGRDPNTADPNFLRLPLHRELADRPGFPRYNLVAFDTTQHVSREHSFGLSMASGSAGAFLQAGAVPVVADTDYLITAEVRTQGLTRGSARMTAYLVDQSGERVDGTLVQSRPINNMTRGGGDWRTLSVTLRGDTKEQGQRGKGPAWIGIELELLQPEPAAGHPLGPQQVTLRETGGRAWFDDVAVWRLPRVEVWTQEACGVVRVPQRPRVTASVRDLALPGGDPMARLRAVDTAGRVVDETSKRLTTGAAGEWSWTPKLPRYGWYLIELAVLDGEAEQPVIAAANQAADVGGAEGEDEPEPVVARALSAVVWLGREGTLRDGGEPRFMLDATGASAMERNLLPEVMRAAGLRAVTLSAWSRDTELASLAGGQASLESLLGRLRSEGVEPTLSFQPVPEMLAKGLRRSLDEGDQGADDVTSLDVLASPRRDWGPWVEPVLLRQGQQVSNWTLGDASQQAGDAAEGGDASAKVEGALAAVRELAPSPTLRVDWPLSAPPGRGAGEPREGVEYVLHVPTGIAAERLPEQFAAWSEHAAAGLLWLALDRLPADEVDHPQRVEDLALRMIEAWRVEGVRLSLDRPWTDAKRREAAVLPDPLLGVFASVAHRLAGRRVVGEMPVDAKGGERVRAVILQDEADASRGALAVWSEAGDAAFDMDLGGDPTAIGIDVWGNRRLVERERQGEGKHRVEVSTTPRFIEGIDPRLAMLRASLVLDQPFIQSVQRPHRRTLTLTNPFPRPLTGSLDLQPPDGWQVTPTRAEVAIPAGETRQIAITLTPPVSETAGDKSLRARFAFAADRKYDIELATPMELGLTGLDFEATLLITGGDASVEVLITNTGETPRSLYAFAMLPGHARQEQLLTRLEPGQSITRTFRFPRGVGALRDHPLRAGVRETDGPAMVTRRLELNAQP